MAEQEANGGLGRPLPHFNPASITPTKQDEVLYSDDDDGGSGGGRRHASASVSKTSFSADTPASQKRAIQSLKQSLTFSDNSSHSSAASTPQKTGARQSGQGSTHSLQSSTQSAPPTFGIGRPAAVRESEPVDEGEGSEYISEGEIPAEISITAIMSKLEQVKSYLQEAQALHQQMKERLSEPGMAVQVNKMGRLVEDLRRQESGYLSILVKLLDQQKGGPLANSSQERTAETDDSREVLSDGEVSGELADEVGGEKRDDSMSLKAELLKERMETQREEKEKQELRMLREQRDLLTKLVEQQKQIEALEVRQRRLLDGNTTGHPPATTKTQAPPSEAGVLRNGAGQEKRQARVTTENMDDETTESAVVRRLQELRERRARVEHLTSLLAQLQTDTENERESQVPTSSAVAAAGNTGQQPLGGAGSGELVAAGSQAMPAELLELHQKLRQAQEAREKLAELQQMISLLQEPDVEGSEVTQDPPLVSSSRQGLLTRESQFEQQQQQQHRGEEEEEDEEDGQTESGELMATGELEASVISEYEERLVRRRREVRELQEQRDRLLTTQRKLQQLHQSIADNASLSPTNNTASGNREQSVNAPSSGGAEGVLSSEELATELGRQRRLYDELLDKTQQIQSMVDEVTSARDMSGATWGGSSSEEEEEEEEGVSSGTGLNDTRDGLEQTFTGTLGGSAVVVVEEDEEQRDGGRGGGEGEEVLFRVTRHTPHHLHGGQRRLLTPETTPHSAGKRMKLDDTLSAAPAVTAQAGSVKAPPQPSTKPAIGSLSAAWPGVIFPSSSSSSRKQTREEATQTGRDVMGQGSLAETHLSFLHHQLAATSSLASQLVVSQQTLVGSVCRQLETQQLAGCFQDHFARLHHYQTQLEQQYQQLQAAFYKLEVAAGEREDDQEDEELDRYREEPVFHARPPSPQPPFTSTTPPPPDTPQSSNTRGRPFKPANEKRERDDFEQSATEPGPTMSGSQTRRSDRRRSSFFQMLPPPGAYLPHLYQPVPPNRRDPEREEEEEEGESVDDGVAAGFFPPPPPLPPYFHPHPFPYYYPPPPPHHHLYPPWVPPTPHLGGHNMSFPHLQTSTSFNTGPSVSPLPSHPNPYPNFRLYPGVAPVYPGHTPYDSFFGLNSSGHHAFGPSYPPHHMGGHIGGGGGYEGVLRGVTREGGEQHQRPVSPSGVTGVSMQVQPPSSPPSAPSDTNLPQTSSLADPNTGSGLLPQSSSGTLMPPVPTSVSQTRAPSSSLPKLTTLTSHSNHHTLTGSASNPRPLQSVPQSWGGVERSRQGGGREEGGGERKKVAGSLAQDDESLSSLPLSLPDDTSKRETRGEEGEGERAPGDFSVFDALRDTIYSEVATLIANNENRPHFLVELFRELQMLSSDYLRQRALYSLQDLVTRYLTEEGLQGRGRGRKTSAPGLEYSWSEQTPSESLVTSDDDEFGRASAGGERERREEEEEEEGSHQSTPPRPRGKAPSASGLTGDTVVRLDKAIARLRESYGSSGTMQPPVVSPGPLQKQPHINTGELDQQIKAVMTEVIPLLKGHMEKSCSPELLQEIRQLVMKLTLTQLKIQGPGSVETFCKQLETALENALQKYLNQMLKECGEALLVEVSEVLFNELAFFRLAQTMEWKNEPGLGSAPKPSQSKEVEGEVEGDEGRAAEVLPVLQALTTAVEKSLSEEQEALGKTRDDELAREWNGPQDGPSSPGLEEDQTIIVELSASESKPIESVGSGEEGEGNEEEGKNSTGTTAKNTGGREETPPTPVIAAVTGTGTAALSTQSPPPDLSTDTKVDVQMKLEQASTGGIAGILASVEQEPELAGESDQLPEPTGPSEAVAEP